MKKKLVKLVDELGFHYRPIASAINKLKEFDCTGYVFYNGQEEAMDSIMKLVALHISVGETFYLATEGKEAMQGLYAMLDELTAIGFIEVVEE